MAIVLCIVLLHTVLHTTNILRTFIKPQEPCKTICQKKNTLTELKPETNQLRKTCGRKQKTVDLPKKRTPLSHQKVLKLRKQIWFISLAEWDVSSFEILRKPRGSGKKIKQHTLHLTGSHFTLSYSRKERKYKIKKFEDDSVHWQNWMNFSQILRVRHNNTAEMTECIVLSPIVDGKSSQEWNNKK